MCRINNMEGVVEGLGSGVSAGLASAPVIYSETVTCSAASDSCACSGGRGQQGRAAVGSC
eukprot:gene34178-24621_t